LRITDGTLSIPRGPGVGIADPKDILKGAVVVPAEPRPRAASGD